MKPTVLTVNELAERWQVSKSKIYADNAEGKLPHLKNDRNRFPIRLIEDMENDPEFDPTDIPNANERRLMKENKRQQELINLKSKEIYDLKRCVAKAQAFLTGIVYQDICGQAIQNE